MLTQDSSFSERRPLRIPLDRAILRVAQGGALGGGRDGGRPRRVRLRGRRQGATRRGHRGHHEPGRDIGDRGGVQGAGDGRNGAETTVNRLELQGDHGGLRLHFVDFHSVVTSVFLFQLALSSLPNFQPSKQN